MYRYNAKRFDPTSGLYDMGFRDYKPGLNRFLSRDMYTGALADLNLQTSPWTGNRYAFTGGNPTTLIEHDGHFPIATDDAGTPDFKWRGSLGVHDRTVKELRSRVCPKSWFGLVDNCETEYATSLTSRRRADLVNLDLHTIYEVKPDKPDQIRRGKEQVRKYINDLGPDEWSAGGPFQEFTFDYYGNDISVRYAGGGVAAYRPTCDERPSGGKNECREVDLNDVEGLVDSLHQSLDEGLIRSGDEDRDYESRLLPNWAQDAWSATLSGLGVSAEPLVPIVP